eukprot:gene12358-25996_t
MKYLIEKYLSWYRLRRGFQISHSARFTSAPGNCPCQQFITSEIITSLSSYASTGAILVNHNICLQKNREHIDANVIHTLNSSYKYLFGTTYIIDDWIGLGHSINDLRLLEVLLLENITQIVFLRSGRKSWLEWVRHLYYVMFIASKQMPIVYFYNATTKSYESDSFFKYHSPFSTIQNTICYEKVIRRPTVGCCQTCTSISTSNLYRDTAYKLYDDTSTSHYLTSTSTSNEKIITYVSRGSHYRHIANKKEKFQVHLVLKLWGKRGIEVDYYAEI